MARKIIRVSNAIDLMNLLLENDGTRDITIALSSAFNPWDVFAIKDLISMDRSIIDGIKVTTECKFTVSTAVVMAQWDLEDRSIYYGNELKLDGFESLAIGDATDQDISIAEDRFCFNRLAELFSELSGMPMAELNAKLDSRTVTHMGYDELVERNIIGGYFHETIR